MIRTLLWSNTRKICASGLATIAIAALTLSECRNVKGATKNTSLVNGRVLTGFYPQGKLSWAWVARDFSVALTPPRTAAHNGATLTVHLFLPQNEIEEVGPVTLNATIDGRSIGSETFTRSGSFDFVRELPFEVIDTNVLPVHFHLDKSITPSSDRRELAGVISGITLLPRQDP